MAWGVQYGIERPGERRRIVAAVVKTAAFQASLGTFYDQPCSQDEIAQFDKVVRDPKVSVVLVDFPFERTDAMNCAFQPLVGTNDADIVPHETPKLVPVVRDDDGLVGIGDTTLIPLW